MPRPQPLSTDEIAACADRLGAQLVVELQRHGVEVGVIAGPDDALRAAEATELARDDPRVLALYRALYWIRTVALRNINRGELRERLGEQWTEVGLSLRDEELADDLSDILADLVRLKEQVSERQSARERVVASIFAVPREIPISDKYRAALVALIEFGQQFDSSFGTRPRMKAEWGQRQLDLEVALHDAGFADAELAKLFGRGDGAAVAQARWRRRQKVPGDNGEGTPS
ncbi:MAG: hypothetical protein K0R38_2694 [Polyangiaceae bacterium]|jgi:hypothetical protein|nr:hypothetical protein [Polyangiaceae bacterium]